MDITKLYLEILNHLQDGVYCVDPNRRIVFWNRAAEQITGYTQEEIVGRSCQETHLNHIDQEGRPLCTTSCPLYKTLADGKIREHQVLAQHKEGYRIPVRVHVFPVREKGRIVGAVEIFSRNAPAVFDSDLVDQLSDIAMHDDLTHLPNRRYLDCFLGHRLEEYHRFGRRFAVLFADIDDFSRVNNTYGHDAGDAVLKNIASSLLRSVRQSDMVGRWGGEEFLGIYAISTPDQCPSIGERFRSLVAGTESFSDASTIRATISVGVTAIQPEDTAETVIQRADQMMYESKRDGKDRVTSDPPGTL